MYGNAEAGVSLNDVVVKGTLLDIHYMMSYVHEFNYEWNTYNNSELEVPTQISHDINISYSFGRQREFTVSAECRNISTKDSTTTSRCRSPDGRSPSKWPTTSTSETMTLTLKNNKH